MSNGMQKESSGDRQRGGDAKVQGEGDYEASQRYRQEVREFLEHADVDALARKAAPGSALEARELALAQDQGALRSRGDDPADVRTMYPGNRDRHPDSGTDDSGPGE